MKAKITTVQDAKDLAHKITGDTPEAKAEKLNLIEDLSNSIAEINPSMGGFEEIAMLLALPDEHFNVLAPVFLNELERSFSNPEDQVGIAQTMNAMGVKVEEIMEQYEDLAREIDLQMDSQLPPVKRTFLKRMIATIFNSIAQTQGISKRIIQIPCEITKGAKKPNYAKLGDAGLDVYALEDYTINPGETVLIKTGIKVAIPKGYEFQVRPKSGISLKSKLRVANTPGTIDCGYRDEIGVIIENIDPPIRKIHYTYDDNGKIIIQGIDEGAPYYIEKGQKIAQLVLTEVTTAHFYEVDNIGEIEGNRGGGFGSTGLA